MDLLLTKTPREKINAHVLPMLASALAAPSVQIQELCLSIIPNFSDQVEITSMKNSILPRIRKIVLEGGTTAVSVFEEALVMFAVWIVKPIDNFFKVSDLVASHISSSKPITGFQFIPVICVNYPPHMCKLIH